MSRAVIANGGEPSGCRTQPSATPFPSTGEKRDEVTLPTCAPATKSCAPSSGAPFAGEGERQQRALARDLRQALERRPADEVGLLHLDRPPGADLGRRAVEIGVQADDEMPLLEPQQLQRVEAVRPEAELRAGRAAERPRAPDSAGVAMMELDRQLADEADADRPAGDAGHRISRDAAVGERRGVDRIVGELRQQLAGARPGDVDGALRPGQVGDVDVELPGLRPFAQPATRRRRPPTR